MVTTQGRPRGHENRAQEVDQNYISVFFKKSPCLAQMTNFGLKILLRHNSGSALNIFF